MFSSINQASKSAYTVSFRPITWQPARQNGILYSSSGDWHEQYHLGKTARTKVRTWQRKGGEKKLGNPTSDRTCRMHFNCDFHPCALAKRRREARIPSSAASGAACTSLCIDLPKVSLFQLPDRPNRPEISGYVPPAFALDARIRSPSSSRS